MNINKIIRSKRKTIALQIYDDTTLIVRSPFGVGYDVIERFITKHHKWLENKKNELLSRDLRFTKKEFINGEGFLFYINYFSLE